MSTNRKAKTNVVQLNPALKGYALDKRHPINGHKPYEPEYLALVAQGELGKVDTILRAVRDMAAEHSHIRELVGVSLQIVCGLVTTFEYEEECHRDAKLAARA